MAADPPDLDSNVPTLEDFQARGCYCRERRVGIDVGKKVSVPGEMVCLDEFGLNWIVVRANAQSQKPPQVNHEHYLGGIQNLGIKAYALSETGVWCGSQIPVKVMSEQSDTFPLGTVRLYIERLGKDGLIGQRLCPQAKRLAVWGYLGNSPKPVFHGEASVDFDWELRTVSRNPK